MEARTARFTIVSLVDRVGEHPIYSYRLELRGHAGRSGRGAG